ncbi:MAG: zinc-dependent metalloprotease [Fulvivirga sp.]
MKKLYILLFAALLLAGHTELQAQKKKKKKGQEEETQKPKSKVKAYGDVITSDAVTDEGIIDYHKVDNKYYFEIPENLLGKEILIVSRISGHVKGLNFGGAGMKSRPQQVIRFQKKDDQILMRSVSYNAVADEELPIYQSVVNNNFEPIIQSFKIETTNEDEKGYVIDVEEFFTTDIPMIGALSENQRKNFKISSVDKSRSVISWAKSFPENIEIRHILTYKGSELPDNQLTNTLSIEMNQSMILLPENPMVPRLHDDRVGFFSINQIDYGLDEQKAASRRFITRWRLVPSDWDAFNAGEAVEPVKPIVYYIDPATPEKWRPYIKQGVEDWQTAFEKAGLKNAIIAKDAPTKEEDPDWSPEDVRYSVIRYISTDIQNAQGPHVHDPRTGEILESDILWYHNVMNLLRNWFFVQTAAVNPEAQGIKFKDELMGELIRFVSAHEVGHTLGFPHNMGSSVAYPVDSLRSPTFTATHGTAPSIMDYARFNYIAQPEDGVTNFYPQLGEYDDWAVWYGYRPIPNVVTPEDEKETLHNWVLDKGDNPLYRYGRQRGNPVDPTAQTEDLGDDSMEASKYGIANLKRINENLTKWAILDGEDYDELEELYGQVVGQYNRYMGHVTSNVGGVYEYYKTGDQEGAVYTHATKDKQQRAVKFLNEQLFATPTWLINEQVLNKVEEAGMVDRIKALQTRTLGRLVEEDRLKRMLENEALNGSAAYSANVMFTDLRNGVYGELASGRAIDTYRRNLQKAMVEELGKLYLHEDDDIKTTDIPSMARGHLNAIKTLARTGVNRQSREVNKFHLQYLVDRIDDILDNKGS